MEEMSRDELIEKLEALQPEFEKIMRQFGAHEPDWEPLKIVFGPLMFMGYSDGIRMYKHKYTRRYLNLDAEGAAYRWLGEKKGYVRIPLEEGIADAFADAEALMGWLRGPGESSAPQFGDVPPGDPAMYDDIHRCEEDPDLP